MQLLVIRHAVAEARETFAATGQPDDLRPLTKKGIRKMRRAARGLRRIVPRITMLASSPFTRATETADIIRDELDSAPVVVLDELKPDAPFEGLHEWLRGLDDDETVAIVGHEPHLSAFVSWLLTGDANPILILKKGCAVLVDMPADGRPKLRWVLTPRLLRRLR